MQTTIIFLSRSNCLEFVKKRSTCGGMWLAIDDGRSKMTASPMIGLDICHTQPYINKSLSHSCLEGSIPTSSQPHISFIGKPARLTASSNPSNSLFSQPTSMRRFAFETLSLQKQLLLCTLISDIFLGKFSERTSVCESW